MVYVKRMVCLANSRKLSGRCVAGKELSSDGPGAWIRPISDRPSEEVSRYERQYEDGTDPKVLDTIEVPLLSPKPNPYQPENWLLDPNAYWEHTGDVGWGELEVLIDQPLRLWENGSSSGSGLNDRIPLANAAGLGGSLYLLYLKDMRLTVFVPGTAFGNRKRRVQGIFTYQHVRYALWVTDPVIEDKYLLGEDGEFAIGECYATISLGEPYEGYCYKFVAAVITPERGRA